MKEQISQNFFRMVEGIVSAPLPAGSSYVVHSQNKLFTRKNCSQGYSIKYVVAGQEEYTINGQRQVLGAGKLLLVNHGSETEVHIKAQSPVEGLCIYLQPAMFAQVWDTLQQDHGQLLENIAPASAMPAFPELLLGADHLQLGQEVAQLYARLRKQPAQATALTEELFYELAAALSLVQGQCLRQMDKLEAQKKTTREELLRRLLLARDFILDNQTHTLSLAQLADAASLSEYHFLRSFKAAFGESPYQYLLRQRLERAKQLLALRKLPVGEVALACGFQEVQAFSKLFRKATGISPTAYAAHFKN